MTHAPEPWAEDGLSRHCGQDLTASLPAKVSQHENPTSPNPTFEGLSFEADDEGTYIVSLVMHDGSVNSELNHVTTIAITTQTRLTQTLSEAIDIINGFDPAVFKNSKM